MEYGKVSRPRGLKCRGVAQVIEVAGRDAIEEWPISLKIWLADIPARSSSAA